MNMKTILVDAVHCYISREGEIFREMHNLLETYPNKKIVLTGADEEEYKKFGLSKIPYKVFTLKHNPEKTNPEYYKKVLERLGLRKDNVVYFEHSKEAVESARSVGIDTYYYDNDKKDLVALKNFLGENL